MIQHKALGIRIVIAIGLIYAVWTYVVQPAHAKLDLLKTEHASQQSLIEQAGANFEDQRAKTDEVYKVVHLASDRVFSAMAVSEEHVFARDLISVTAREHSVGINRIEPLREVELTSKRTRNRYKMKSEQDTKIVRFLGEGIRVELDGTFSNIAGLLHDLDQYSETLKLENFRMVSSGDGGSRMIAQFMKYELVEAPILHTAVAMSGSEQTATED